MACAYQSASICSFLKSMGIFLPQFKHMCTLEKTLKLLEKIFFHLEVNIVGSVDNFCFYFVIYQSYNLLTHHATVHYVELSSWISWHTCILWEGWEKFQNYMDKRLLVYNYYKIVANALKNINTLFTCDAWTMHSVYYHFLTHIK
jgi:hypothetical protein